MTNEPSSLPLLNGVNSGGGLSTTTTTATATTTTYLVGDGDVVNATAVKSAVAECLDSTTEASVSSPSKTDSAVAKQQQQQQGDVIKIDDDDDDPLSAAAAAATVVDGLDPRNDDANNTTGCIHAATEAVTKTTTPPVTDIDMDLDMTDYDLTDTLVEDPPPPQPVVVKAPDDDAASRATIRSTAAESQLVQSYQPSSTTMATGDINKLISPAGDDLTKQPPSDDVCSVSKRDHHEQLKSGSGMLLLQGGHKRKLVDESLIDFLSEDELLGGGDGVGSNQQLSSSSVAADFDDEDAPAHLKPSKHAKISTSVETIDSNESLVIGAGVNSTSTNCPGSNNSSFGLEEKCTISSSSVYEEAEMSSKQPSQNMRQQPPTFLTILPNSASASCATSKTSSQASPSITLSPTFSTGGSATKSSTGQSPPVVVADNNSGLDYFTLVLSYKSASPSDRDSGGSGNSILIDGVGENVYTFLRYHRKEMIGKSISTFVQPADLSKFVNLFTTNAATASATSPTFHATAPPSSLLKHGGSNSSTTGSPSSPSPNNSSNSKQHRTFTCHMLSKQLLSPTLLLSSSPASSSSFSGEMTDSVKPVNNNNNNATAAASLQYELMTITAGQTTVSSNDKKETVLCLVQMNTKAQPHSNSTTATTSLQIPHPISIKTPPLPQIYQATTSLTSPTTLSGLTSPTGGSANVMPPVVSSYDCNMDVVITKMTKRGLVLWIDVASLKNTSFIGNIPGGVDGIRSGLLYSVIKLGKMADIHEFVHNNDMVHINKHISDVCSKKENISAIYRLKISDKHAFVNTSSKLIDEMVDPKWQVDENDKTLIYSAHSIIKEIDSEVEMKGNASTSLMKTLISKKPASAAAAVKPVGLLMAPSSPSSTGDSGGGGGGGNKRGANKSDSVKSSSVGGGGGNVSPKSLKTATATVAVASQQLTTPNTPPIGAKFAIAMLGLNASTSNPNIFEKVQRLSETLLEPGGGKIKASAPDAHHLLDRSKNATATPLLLPHELKIKDEKLDHYEMKAMLDQQENDYKEPGLLLGVGAGENEMPPNESSQSATFTFKTSTSTVGFYDEAQHQHQLDIKPDLQMDHQNSLNELDLNSNTAALLSNLTDHGLDAGKENEDFDTSSSLRIGGGGGRRLDKSLENELRSKLESSLLAPTSALPSQASFAATQPGVGKEENILRALLDAKEPEETVITLEAIGGSVFKNSKSFSRNNSINSSATAMGCGAKAFSSSIVSQIDALKSPSFNNLKKPLLFGFADSADAMLNLKLNGGSPSPGKSPAGSIDSSTALSRLSSLAAESDSFLLESDSPKQSGGSASKKKKNKSTKTAQQSMFVDHHPSTMMMMDPAMASSKPYHSNKRIKPDQMISPPQSDYYGNGPVYKNNLAAPASNNNNNNNNNNSLLKQMLDNNNSVQGGQIRPPSMVHDAMFYAQQQQQQQQHHLHHMAQMNQQQQQQQQKPMNFAPYERQFSNPPQQMQQQQFNGGQDISIGIQINEYSNNGGQHMNHQPPQMVDENDDVLRQLDQVFSSSSSTDMTGGYQPNNNLNMNSDKMMAPSSSSGMMMSAMYASSEAPTALNQQQQHPSQQQFMQGVVGIEQQQQQPVVNQQYLAQMPPLQVQVSHSSMSYSAQNVSPHQHHVSAMTIQQQQQQHMMAAQRYQNGPPANDANNGLLMNPNLGNQAPPMNNPVVNVNRMQPSMNSSSSGPIKDDELIKQRRIEAITKHLKTDLIDSFKSAAASNTATSVSSSSGGGYYLDDNNNIVMDNDRYHHHQQQMKQAPSSLMMANEEKTNVPNVTIGGSNVTVDPSMLQYQQYHHQQQPQPQQPQAQPRSQPALVQPPPPQFYQRRGSGAGFVDEAGNECDVNGNRLNPGQNNLMKRKLQSCLLNKNVVSGGGCGNSQNSPGDQQQQQHQQQVGKPTPMMAAQPSSGGPPPPQPPNTVNVAVVTPQIVQPPPAYQAPPPLSATPQGGLLNPSHYHGGGGGGHSPNKAPKSVPSPINPELGGGGMYGQQPPGASLYHNKPPQPHQPQQQASIMATTQLTQPPPPTTTTTTTVTVTTQHYNPSAMAMPPAQAAMFNGGSAVSAPVAVNPVGLHPQQPQPHLIHHHHLNQQVMPMQPPQNAAAPPPNVIYHSSNSNGYSGQPMVNVAQKLQPPPPPNSNLYQAAYDNSNSNMNSAGGYFNNQLGAGQQQSFAPNTSPQPPMPPGQGFMSPIGQEQQQDLDQEAIRSQMMFKSPNSSSMKQPNQNDYVKKQLGSAVSKRINNKPADFNNNNNNSMNSMNSEPFMTSGPNPLNMNGSGNSPAPPGQYLPTNQMDGPNYANQMYSQPPNAAPNANYGRTISPSLNNGGAQQNPSFYGGQPPQFQPQFNNAQTGIPTPQSFNNQTKPVKTGGGGGGVVGGPYQQQQQQQPAPQQRVFDEQQMMMNPQYSNNPATGINNNSNQPVPNSMDMQFSLDKQNDSSLDLISGDFDFSSMDVPDPTSTSMDDMSSFKTMPGGFDEMQQTSYGGGGGYQQQFPSSQQFASDQQQYQMPLHQHHQHQLQQQHHQPDFGMGQQQQHQQQQAGHRFTQYAGGQPVASQHNSNANAVGSSLKLLLD